MPQIALVGDGHGGNEDYLTLALWWATESSVDYGTSIEAQCLGYYGDNFSLSGASINGASFYTKDITYDGSNGSSLSYGARVGIKAEISWHDIKFLHTRQYYNGLYLRDLGNATGTRWLLEASGTGATSATAMLVSSGCVNSTISEFVIDGGANVWLPGYNGKITAKNFIICNAGNRGFDGYSFSYPTLQDGFLFNNGIDFKDNTRAVSSYIATEDGTSPSGLTGYTSAELVDFANGDYRTKATSALATAGTNGGFIGAFLESGGGATPFKPFWALANRNNNIIGA